MSIATSRAVRATAAAGVGTLVAATLATGESQASQERFQLPFKCGQTWVGSSGSSAHQAGEIDFNKGSGNDDMGEPVLAVAAGRVTTAAYSTTSGYGNYVVIKHGALESYYAHLKSMAVRAGQKVEQGQRIGRVGNTSATYSFTSHLHYEVRGRGMYPDSIRNAVFNGRPFSYPTASVTSHNCGKNTPKPKPQPRYSAKRICGPAYKVREIRVLRRGKRAFARVVLLYDAQTRKHCAATVKLREKGRKSRLSVFLAPKGARVNVDSGRYEQYAGPVRFSGGGCFRWGGSMDGMKFRSKKCDSGG